MNVVFPSRQPSMKRMDMQGNFVQLRSTFVYAGEWDNVYGV